MKSLKTALCVMLGCLVGGALGFRRFYSHWTATSVPPAIGDDLVIGVGTVLAGAIVGFWLERSKLVGCIILGALAGTFLTILIINGDGNSRPFPDYTLGYLFYIDGAIWSVPLLVGAVGGVLANLYLAGFLTRAKTPFSPLASTTVEAARTYFTPGSNKSGEDPTTEEGIKQGEG